MDYVIEPLEERKLVKHKGPGDVVIGTDIQFGNNVTLIGNVKAGNKCKIGNNVLLRSVVIGDNTVIEDNCIIGYDNITGPFRDRGIKGDNQDQYHQLKVIIGDNVLIRNGCTIYLGARIHDNCWINHNSLIRHKTVIGKNSCIGSHCCCHDNVSIGENCAILNHTDVTAQTRIEACVFVGPNVTFTNNAPIAHQRDLPDTIRAPVLRFGCAIGGGVTIYPGIEVGEESIVAGGATVIRNVLPKTIVGGNPAKKLKDIDESYRIKEDIRRLFGII